jgi:hypothetical protein
MSRGTDYDTRTDTRRTRVKVECPPRTRWVNYHHSLSSFSRIFAYPASGVVGKEALRVYECLSSGLAIDRDNNDSMNILNQALEALGRHGCVRTFAPGAGAMGSRHKSSAFQVLSSKFATKAVHPV